MKKINKYFSKATAPSLSEELSRYKKMASEIQKDAFPAKVKKMSPLSLIIPFAAASLSPFGVNAQCLGTSTPEGGGSLDILVDIDGDGTDDFEVAEQGGDLILFVLNSSAEVAAQSVGIYDYPTNFAAGAAISSANPNWKGVGDLQSYGGPFATMAYNDTAGNWAPNGTGYVGVKVGNQLGFIEVTWNGPGNTAVIGLTGLQDGSISAANTSVDAGDCDALPVELVKFEGAMFESHSELKWSTASEADNKGFEIQRSKDGVSFETVGFVEGQGYSDRNIDYSFKDDAIRTGTNYYYRLNQVDFWQTATLSEVILLEAERSIDFEISPNPIQAGSMLSINNKGEKNQTWETSVFDTKGALVIAPTSAEGNRRELDIQQLEPGVYYLKISSASAADYKKFIVQ